MAEDPSNDFMEKISDLIARRFHVPTEYAQRLAVAALDGIEAHGGSSRDWPTIEETIMVVVASWIKVGAYK